jgi:hypothetical protein
MRLPEHSALTAALRAAALLFAATATTAPAQHPALTPPPGFVVAEGSTAANERTFVQVRSNGDRLRVRVFLLSEGADVDAAAKKTAADASDTTLDATRQDVSAGALSGVAYSCLGSTENVDGLPFTRYRRVFGFALKGAAPFAARADVLAKEPRPSGNTLETMARALADWQRAIGGETAPPPDPEGDPASRPALGGSVTIAATGGGDAEFRVPAAWGRADIDFGDGRTAIFVGPARDVLASMTKDTLAVDLDRLGPYVRFERIRKSVFDDLVDQRLLDIADSLLDDYVVSQEEAGVTLTLGERDEGTLGTRVVVSVPFEEARKSGTKHKGRLVAMLHRGVLVLVTASHPSEAYDQGWPDVAAALDTLVFTGAPEADPATTETRAAADATAKPEAQDAAAPEKAAPANESPAPTAPRVAAGPLKLPPGKPDATDATAIDGAVVVRLAAPLPIAFAHPSGFELFGATSLEAEAWAFVAAPSAAGATEATKSRVRLEYRAFREDLAVPDAGARLMRSLGAKIRREASEQALTARVAKDGERRFGDADGAFVVYDLVSASGELKATGRLSGAALDGTVVLYDVRAAANDRDVAAKIDALSGAFHVRSDVSWTRRRAGSHTIDVPASWTFDESENRVQGRDVFIRSPAGVDVRVQTARLGKTLQAEPERVSSDVLRRIAYGFLVESLRVLTPREFQDVKKFEAPGAAPGLRFASSGPSLDAFVVAAVANDDVVFAMRAAPLGYKGRDMAIAYRVATSVFGGRGGVRGPSVSGRNFTDRAVFSRTEFDDLSAEGDLRPPSVFYVAFLPDGTAGVLLSDGRAKRDLRATYAVSGSVVELDCEGLGGLRRYTLVDGGETLVDEAGDALFRARREETP